MPITPLSIGSVPSAGLATARRAPSQDEMVALVAEIQGASSGVELEALGRKVRGFSATPSTDPALRARIDQMRMAMRLRRDELK